MQSICHPSQSAWMWCLKAVIVSKAGVALHVVAQHKSTISIKSMFSIINYIFCPLQHAYALSSASHGQGLGLHGLLWFVQLWCSAGGTAGMFFGVAVVSGDLLQVLMGWGKLG